MRSTPLPFPSFHTPVIKTGLLHKLLVLCEKSLKTTITKGASVPKPAHKRLFNP